MVSKIGLLVLFVLCLVAGVLGQGGGQASAASEQYDAAKGVLDAAMKQQEVGNSNLTSEQEPYCAWSRRLAETAVQANALSPDVAFAQHQTRMTELMEQTKRRAAAGMVTVLEQAIVKYYLAEARVLAERSRGK